METANPGNEEQQNSKRPDFLEDGPETDNFGESGDDAITEENYPAAGNQTQTGAATDNSDLEIEPEDDGDDSLAGTDD